MQETHETQVQSLGCEDPLEKGMAPHSSIHAWEIPQMEEPGGLQSVGVTKSQTQWSTHTPHLFVRIFLVVRLTFPLLVRPNL